MRKIAVPIDTPTELDFGDTAADIHWTEAREQR